MRLTISKRNLIRIISFITAALLVLLGLTLRATATATDYRRQLEISYSRSLGELSSYLTNIATDLDKGKYVGTSGQLIKISSRIWRESGGAKSALSLLPVSELHMDNTYKFISQVGDYAMTLSDKVARGIPLTDEEKQNAEALRQYAGKLREYVDDVLMRIQDGEIDIQALRSDNLYGGDDTEGTQTSGIVQGFEDIEQTMTGYPTLIYDGPFSDHLLNQKPRLTQSLSSVSPEQAQENAAKAAQLSVSELTRGDDENSNMPSYTFQADGISVGVTKAGGIVTYMINSREIGEERQNQSATLKNAERYLAELGYENMRATYFETADGVCTINYAATEGDVILYTDLIKVGVALDDGSIVFYDARGYISNHRDRSIPEPTITASEAAASVSSSLSIRSNRLALIPTSGKNEVLTYEFQTVSMDDDEQKVLVYVNAQTGVEEQILLLLESPTGTLTK